MIKDDFYNYLEKMQLPDVQKDSQMQSGFEALVKSYPYFSIAAACLSKILKEKSHSGFEEILSFTSARVNNRKQLYYFVNDFIDITTKPLNIDANAETLEDEVLNLADDKTIESQNIERPVTAIETTNRIEHLPESTNKSTEKDIIQQILSYPEIKKTAKELKEEAVVEKEANEAIIANEAVLPKSRKMGFNDWLKAVKTDVSSHQHFSTPTVQEKPAADKNSLIERFIKTEPRISAPSKKEFFSPAIMAKKSIEDHDDIVTETLAQIHIQQGNIPKAIKIYDKLMLIYPEKSSYFAALIEKLNKA